MKKAIALTCLLASAIALSSGSIAQQPNPSTPPGFAPQPRFDTEPNRKPFPPPQQDSSSVPFSFGETNGVAPKALQNSATGFSAPNNRTYSDPANANLQNQFAQVAGELAQLLDDSELEAQIKQYQARIIELKARRKLRTATSTLEQLLKEFPDSDAAQRAARMLGKTAPGDSEEGSLDPGDAFGSDKASFDRNDAKAAPPTRSSIPRR